MGTIAKSVDTNIRSINYPVRIHWTVNCKCMRILTPLTENITHNHEYIICVLEKIWINKSRANRFRGFTCIKENKNNTENFSSLVMLFSSTMESRRTILNYFKNYCWLPHQSIKVRQMIHDINSVCFCRDSLVINKMTCNAGFVIIGNQIQMEKISHCFNKYIKKTEFSSACYIKLDNIKNINRKEMDHTLVKFNDSTEYHKLRNNSSLYTLLGVQTCWDLESSDIKKTIYGFPFGKREWCDDLIESSFDCAKRELYEEFNIQFSQSLWDHNTSLKMPKYVHMPGFILYMLYLSNDILIGYHNQSNTIYLDKI